MLRGDTQAALWAAQQLREQQLHEQEKVLAKRYVARMSEKHDWPAGDADEVMAALGIIE